MRSEQTRKKNEETADAPAEAPSRETPTVSFEHALARLETLVGEMESGNLSLDAMLASYSEGQQLIRHCERKLNEVERRIEVLKRDETGAIVATPFQLPPEPGAGDSGGEAADGIRT